MGGMLRSAMISSIGLIALFFTGTLGAPSQESECCQEKRVGDTFYTLLSDDSFSGGVPERCLNDCLYTAIGTSEPKFCFARGELPVECGGSGYGSGSGEGSGYGQSSVSISFIVRSATTNEDSYWMLGSFEPSGGISSFVEDGSFQTDNPDTSLTARNENPVKPSSF